MGEGRGEGAPGHLHAPGSLPCSEKTLCLATLACAQVVVMVAGLGLVGVLSTGTLVAAAMATAAVSLARVGPSSCSSWLRGSTAGRGMSPGAASLLRQSGLWPGYLGVATALLVLGARALSQPPLVYDDLNYHLAYPVEWWKTGRLDNPYLPWGAQTLPFYGLNFELVYLWLLAPVGSDVVAKMAQLPALALLSVAVYAGARILEAGRRESALAALLPWSNPSLVTQAFFNVNSDLWAAFFALVSLVLALAVWRRGPALLVPASLAVGLFLGSRSYSAVYAPVPFAVLVAAIVGSHLSGRHSRRAQRPAPTAEPGKAFPWRPLALDLGRAIALVFVSGGFWYARNLLLVGNPLQPSLGSVALALSDDLYGEGVQYSLQGFLLDWRGHGVAVPAVLLGFLAVGLVVAVRERRRDGALFGARLALLAAPLALFVLFYLIPPFQRYERFLMPVVPVVYPAVALVLSRLRGCGLGTPAALAASAALGAYPLYAAIKQLAPGRTLVLPAVPAAVAMMVALLALAALLLGRWRGRWTWTRVGLGLGLALLAVAVLGEAAVETRLHRYEVWRPHVDGFIGQGWEWIELATAEKGATIAYAGNNLPYPLYGSRYQNRVLAVPVRGGTSATHYGFGREPRAPSDAPDQARWRQAVADLGVEYLFLSSFLVDSGEFPIEEGWARSDPGSFSLVYSNERTRIYRVER